MGEQTKFKVRDLVEYDTTRYPKMKMWAHLNGRKGLVVGLGELRGVPELGRVRCPVVRWFFGECEPFDPKQGGYDPCLLRVIGHIED